MTLTVLLMRHGKSAWDEPDIADRERKLSKRGKADALLMGHELHARGMLPDVILSSPARRARATVARVVKTSGYQGQVAYDDDFYPGDLPALLHALTQLPAAAKSVLLVGHNPSLEELALVLTGRVVAMPTATVACIDLPPETWGSLNGAVRGTLRAVLTPADAHKA